MRSQSQALRIDAIDIYLLHWRERNTRPAETVKAFEKLRATGRIKRWGVSNFDVEDMKELFAIENGDACAANQVLYNLQNREIESGLLQWSGENKIPIMAYSPVGHGRGLLENTVLKKIAKHHEATAAQIALAWLLGQPGIIAIPKASKEEHVRDNAQSIEIKLTRDDLADLDREFPPPKSKKPLPTL
jgi:diketogulonate reductase-like aldo/keto reductase